MGLAAQRPAVSYILDKPVADVESWWKGVCKRFVKHTQLSARAGKLHCLGIIFPWMNPLRFLIFHGSRLEPGSPILESHCCWKLSLGGSFCSPIVHLRWLRMLHNCFIQDIDKARRSISLLKGSNASSPQIFARSWGHTTSLRYLWRNGWRPMTLDSNFLIFRPLCYPCIIRGSGLNRRNVWKCTVWLKSIHKFVCGSSGQTKWSGVPTRSLSEKASLLHLCV